MTFAVDIAGLRAVPEISERLSRAALQCDEYAARYFTFTFGPGLINSVTGRHEEAQRQVSRFFTELRQITAELGRAVQTALDSYRATDQMMSAALDALLPAVGADLLNGRSATLRPDLIPPGTTEPDRPTDALTEPPDYAAQDPYQPSWTDLVSPGTLYRDAVFAVTWLGAQIGLLDRAYDPYDDFTMPLVGNWARMHALADALHHLAEAARQMAENADWIALRIDASWLGNAGDAALVHVRRIATALRRASSILDQLSGAYAAVLNDMKEINAIMALIIGDLIDAACFAVVAEATADTVIGPAIFLPAMRTEIGRVVNEVNGLLTRIQRAQVTVDLFGGKIGGLGILDAHLPHLPAVPVR